MIRSRALAGAAIILVSGAALTAGPAFASARGETPTLRELERGWTRPTPLLPASAGPTSSARVEAISALGGGQGVKGCVTPLMIALSQRASRLNQPTRKLLDRATSTPTSGSPRQVFTADGEFLIHFWTEPGSQDAVQSADDDLNGLPDGVEKLGAELSDVLADFVHVLDWPPAPSPSRDRLKILGEAVDVYLVALDSTTGGAEGFTMPLEHAGRAPGSIRGEVPEGADAAIYLDSRLASLNVSSRAAVAHQVAHLVQIRDSAKESPWWYEASALWLQDRLEGTAPALAARFGADAWRRGAGLFEERLAMDPQAFLWPHYVTTSTGGGPDLIRKLWQEMASVPGNNTVEAMDRVLRRLVDTTLAEEIRVFNIWNLFLGQADDGQHYSFGRLMPTPSGDATYEVFPARGASPGGMLAPTGAAVVRLLGDGSRGGLRVRVDGGEGAEWNATLIVYFTNPAHDVRAVPLEFDETGRVEIAFPWRRVAAADLVIQNLAMPGALPAGYSFSIDHDPIIPYDLMSFGATESAQGALISWSTEDEERLAGWNVFRGSALLGPFVKINSYLIPAAGQTGLGMTYLFMDSSVEPRHKYYYYLEGITLEGFTETSNPTGVRLGVAPAGPTEPR